MKTKLIILLLLSGIFIGCRERDNQAAEIEAARKQAEARAKIDAAAKEQAETQARLQAESR